MLFLILLIKNFDVNNSHFNRKTFSAEILGINRISYHYGEIAEINSHFDQRFSKYIFGNSLSQNLQCTKENRNNITFYWINSITPLLFFTTQVPKVLIIISSLIQLTTAYHGLSVSFNRVIVIMNLKNSPTNKILTIKVLQIVNTINKSHALQTTCHHQNEKQSSTLENGNNFFR